MYSCKYVLSQCPSLDPALLLLDQGINLLLLNDLLDLLGLDNGINWVGFLSSSLLAALSRRFQGAIVALVLALARSRGLGGLSWVRGHSVAAGIVAIFGIGSLGPDDKNLLLG